HDVHVVRLVDDRAAHLLVEVREVPVADGGINRAVERREQARLDRGHLPLLSSGRLLVVEYDRATGSNSSVALIITRSSAAWTQPSRRRSAAAVASRVHRLSTWRTVGIAIGAGAVALSACSGGKSHAAPVVSPQTRVVVRLRGANPSAAYLIDG